MLLSHFATIIAKPAHQSGRKFVDYHYDNGRLTWTFDALKYKNEGCAFNGLHKSSTVSVNLHSFDLRKKHIRTSDASVPKGYKPSDSNISNLARIGFLVNNYTPKIGSNKIYKEPAEYTNSRDVARSESSKKFDTFKYTTYCGQPSSYIETSYIVIYSYPEDIVALKDIFVKLGKLNR